MSLEVEVRGLPDAQSVLNTDVAAALVPVLTRSVLRMADQLRRYPPPPASGVWRANTTPRQKRAFFALLRRGVISGERTGRLGRSWRHTVEMRPAELAASLTNDAPYAPFVQGAQSQARFHRGRWTTDAAVIEGEAPVLVREAESALRQAFRR